ncbi:MAG TPA: cation:dicarboxylase symporter family transporter [Thermoanaerobaculia bacterium]|nr:cation:dicarboxylase symporter family transporter [Thermoanaerobaculia bacterium]
MSDRRRRRVSRTTGALLALAAGVAAGLALRGAPLPGSDRIVSFFAAIGQLWVAALRMTVLPLVVGLTLVAIVGAPRDDSVGRLGARSLALFVAMLLGAGILTFAAVAPTLSLFPVGPDTAAALRAGTSVATASASPSSKAASDAATPGRWLLALIPANPFQAAAAGDILPILVFTVAFAVAASRLPAEQRALVGAVSRAVVEAMMVMIGWVLAVLPLGVFALCLDFASRLGLRVTGVIAAYVALLCAALIVATVLLYPLTAALGRVSLARFARAAAPAQAVAASTRSSLASLPALIEGGRRHLGLPDSATGFVLPLSVGVFKLNRTISSPLKLLFLAHVFGIRLELPQLAAFLALQIALSFSTAGIPSMGTIRSIPAYVAVGIPLEGVVILDAMEAIPDVFKTVINVTGDMSVATILSRRERATEMVPVAVPVVEPERISHG